MKSILDSIEQHLKLEGFENTFRGEELRKFVWENSATGVTYTILMNHKMTKMQIDLKIVL